MAKIKGSAVLSNFKRKGDITCYFLRLQSNGKVDTASIAENTKADTRLSTEFATAAMQTLTNEMVNALMEGKRIETQYFSMYLKCLGRFNGPTDKFDPARHQLGIVFAPKPAMKKLLETLEVENMTAHVKVALSFVRSDGVDEKNVVKLGANVFGEGEGLTLVEGREDEYVALIDKSSRAIVAKADVLESSVGTLKAKFAAGAVEPGEYLFVVSSRNGGEESLTPFQAEKLVKVIA